MAVVAVLPAFGSLNVAAASPTAPRSRLTGSSQASPFLPLSAKERETARSRALKRGGSASATRLAIGTGVGEGGAIHTDATTSRASGSKVVKAPPVTSTSPDALAGFAGISQANAIQHFPNDQEITPPNEDVAAGPTDVVEVVNSTIYVFNRLGTILGYNDLNVFMGVLPGYHSSDPRVIYDASAGRFWVTVTEVPDSYLSPSDCPHSAPVLIAVSGSSNPLPFSGWIVYGLPMEDFTGSGQPLTEFGDQPGLGISSNTVTVTFDDYTCANGFNGSEIDVLQKTDFEHDSGFSSLYYFYDGPAAPQPVQGLGAMALTYIVSNQSDCNGNGCLSGTPAALVQAFTGTPEGAGGVVDQTAVNIPMTPTAVDDSTGFLPPADQPRPGPQLQTNDDRFLNAVWENGEIWTADGTSCMPMNDTVQRDCLDYVEIAASGTADSVSGTLTNQVDSFGLNGMDLFYPAVSLDSSGDMITVFDESSTNMLPSIIDASIGSGATTLSGFQTLHTSATFYNGADLFPGACDSEGCRWGDYSGAAQDPVNPKDVWVVSGSADDIAATGPCTTINACWDTRIYEVTLSGPTITSLNAAYGAVAGGQTVAVYGTDFALDTGVTFNGTSIAIANLTPSSFTLVTPPSVPAGSTAFVQASDVLGASTENAASTYTYVGLSNYFPLSPFRILDTRPGSTCIQCLTNPAFGPGATEKVQLTGVAGLPVGVDPIPSGATAIVLNVTEVNGTASSLLTVYPFGTINRPTASNLNFGPRTVTPNLVTVTMGTGGAVSIYNALGSVNVLVDVEGYFTPQPASDLQGLFHPIQPVRVCDTRSLLSCQGHGAVGAGKSIVVTVASTGGIPSDGTAEAGVVNLTGVAGSASTYVSLFPTDPNGHCNPTGTSTLNLVSGAVEANRVMVKLGPTSPGGQDDALCVYNAVGTINVLVDANGWYGSAAAISPPTGYQYQALAPTRICDTRIASTSCASGAISAGTTLQRLITVAGHAGVPTFAILPVVAIIANVTAITPTAGTYLTLFPANLKGPNGVSDLNIGAGAILPNLAVVEVDTIPSDTHDGEVYLYNGDGSVNAIIDLEGWFQ